MPRFQRDIDHHLPLSTSNLTGFTPRNSPERTRSKDVPIALWVSTFLLVGGIFAPVLSVQKVLIFGFSLSETTVSIADILRVLWRDENFTLWGVVLMFSVAIPVTKVTLESALWYVALPKEHATPRLARAAEILSKLSMAEIFAAAILVATLKLDAWVVAELEVGLYFLLASTLAGLWASLRISRALEDLNKWE